MIYATQSASAFRESSVAAASVPYASPRGFTTAPGEFSAQLGLRQAARRPLRRCDDILEDASVPVVISTPSAPGAVPAGSTNAAAAALWAAIGGGRGHPAGRSVVERQCRLLEWQACTGTSWWANALDTSGSPFESLLTLRMLEARLRIQQENTEALVVMLDVHPSVRAVHYPGLPRHPGDDLAVCQQRGFGAMVGVEIEGEGCVRGHDCRIKRQIDGHTDRAESRP